MIGKIVLDKIGVTDKLGGEIVKKVHIISDFPNETQFNRFKSDLDRLEKDPVQVDILLKTHGLEQVKDLKDYILNNNIKQDSVNALIQNQNYQNIANQAHGFKGVNTAIKEYNKLTDTASKAKLAETISSTNSSLGKYLTGLNRATTGIGKYSMYLVGATIKTWALKAATMAFNMVFSMGVSLLVTTGISFLASCIDNIINATKKIKEAAQEAKTAINSIQSEFDTLKSTTNDIKKRFAELAQSVENLGKVSQSRGNLSTEDYEEFLDLSNQLVELFPQLTAGYDDNGNAILNLSGNVDTIVSSLNDMLEVERKLANQKIIDNMDNVWKGYLIDFSKEQNNLDNAKNQFDLYEKTLNKINNPDTYNFQALDLRGDKKVIKTTDEENKTLKSIFNKVGINNITQYTNYDSGQREFLWNIDSLTDEQITMIQKAYGKLTNEYAKTIKLSEDKIAAANSELQSYLSIWLSESTFFTKISTDKQNIVKDMLYNNWSDIIKLVPENAKKDWSSVSDWITRNIIYAIEDINNSQISNALLQVFGNQELMPDEKEKFIKQIQEYFGSEHPIYIALEPQLEDAQALQKQYEAALNKFDTKDRETLEKFFKDNSINTFDEIDNWNEVTAGIQNAEEAMEKFIADKEKSKKITFSSNIKSITDTYKSLTDNASILSSVNKEIAESSKISADNLEKIAEAFPEDKYPEMTKALYQYQLGLIDEQQLFKQLEKAYNQNVANYLDVVRKKAETDTEYFEFMRQKYPEVFETLSKFYKNDVDNWKSVAEAKIAIDTKLLEQLQNKWSDYFKAIKGDNDRYSLYAKKFDDSDIALYDPEEAERLNKEYDIYEKQAQQYVDNANAALEALDKIRYNSADFSWDSISGFDSSSVSDTAKSYDLIERAISKLQRKVSELKNVTDDAFASWSDRNKALIEQQNALTAQMEVQQKAYEKYMQLANASGLPDHYKNLIENGAIEEITVADETLQKQIDSYRDYYDKAMDAADSVKTLKDSLNELENTKMEIISSELDNIRTQISHAINMMNGYIDISEASGIFASDDMYRQMAAYYRQNLTSLYEEQKKLTDQLAQSVADGMVAKGTEAWSNMQSRINEVNESILDTIVNIQNMSNELLNLNFEKFAYLQDKISSLTAESNFYLNLIESTDKELYDENGVFTQEGITAVGLHAQNVNTYLQQAKDYADKISELEAEIANAPLNKNLADKKQEYLEAQREAVLSAQEERNAIANLIKDGYDKQTDALGSIIDQYKTLLSAQKNAYDYEKQMSEKAENLAALQKQYAAWRGDNSEEGMKVRQELAVRIKEAEEDIEETEYEKLISDTEKLLDELQTEYETLLNERIDNIDRELTDITDAVNQSAATIAGVLEGLSQDNNLTLTDTMVNIWKDAQPVIDINASVDTVNETLSGTNAAIDGLRTDVQSILLQMETRLDKNLTSADGYDSEVVLTQYGALPRLVAGDRVLDRSAVENVWELSQLAHSNFPAFGLTANTVLPNMTSNYQSNDVRISFDHVSINLPNVSNYEDFMKQAQKDSHFEQMIQEITLGQALGRNYLNKLQY